MAEIKNAISSDARFVDGRGYKSFFIWLEFKPWTQGFGGVSIKGKDDIIIKKIVETVGAKSFKDLKGKYVRFKDTNGKPIEEIGNIIDNKWFNINDYVKSK